MRHGTGLQSAGIESESRRALRAQPGAFARRVVFADRACDVVRQWYVRSRERMCGAGMAGAEAP